MTPRPAFYSQNENQNYFVNEGKTSSRVLQAPGGTSSINLCWDHDTTNDGEVPTSVLESIKQSHLLLKFMKFHNIF
jgi:hypothetical protein